MFHMTDLAVGALPAAAGHAPSVACYGPYSGPVVEAGFQTYACPYPGAYGYNYPAAGQPPQMQAGPYGPAQQISVWCNPGPQMQPPQMQAGPYGPAQQVSVWCNPGPQMQPPQMQAGPYGPAPQVSVWCKPGPQMQPPQMRAGPYGPAQQVSVWCNPGPPMQPPQMNAPYPYPWPPHAMMANPLQAGIPPYCDPPTNLCPGFHSHYWPCPWFSVFYDQAMPGTIDPAVQLRMLQEQMMSQLGAGQARQGGAGQGMAPTTIAETDRLIQELEATVHQLRAHRAALERLAGG